MAKSLVRRVKTDIVPCSCGLARQSSTAIIRGLSNDLHVRDRSGNIAPYGPRQNGGNNYLSIAVLGCIAGVIARGVVAYYTPTTIDTITPASVAENTLEFTSQGYLDRLWQVRFTDGRTVRHVVDEDARLVPDSSIDSMVQYIGVSK